jgi:carboxyl-terminal processing protease
MIRALLLLLAMLAALPSVVYGFEGATTQFEDPATSLGSELVAADPPTPEALSLIRLFGDVLERVRHDYVDQPDDRKLLSDAIRGMLAGLDAHSTYLDPTALQDMQAQTRGQFGGLGVDIAIEDGQVKVVAAFEDGPAAKAGIMANDIITHVDNESMQGLALNEAVRRLRGPVNSTVKLTIRRQGGMNPIEALITREVIRVRPVRWRIEADDVGYLRITRFNEQTGAGLKDAVAGVSARIPPERLKGYVLDLRNNPGGLLDEAIAVADAFLESGEIVSTRGRGREDDRHYMAHPGDLTGGKPIVVLINGGSASGSEIVAGALKDNARATIVGTRSFGMGTVQTIIPLGPGNGAIRITTARYFTPSGHAIQAAGIVPDIEVLQDVPERFQAKSISAGEGALPGHLKGEGEEKTGSQSYVPPDPKSDKALQAALDTLHGVRTR